MRHGRRLLEQIWGKKMLFNVLAVYEVLGARIGKRKCVQYILTPPLRLQGTQNLAEKKPHKGCMPDCGFSEPEPPTRRRSVYRPVMRSCAIDIFLVVYILPLPQNVYHEL
jgi:hypothetical protein